MSLPWIARHPDDLGYLPSMLSEHDPRPAREQLDAHYRHGGGWRPFGGFRFDRATASIAYPGDPPLLPIAATQLREETIYVYEGSWVLVLQEDGRHEVARMD